jgi:hypothetical protein
MDDDRIADPWGARTPYAPGQPWPALLDDHLAGGADAAVVRSRET